MTCRSNVIFLSSVTPSILTVSWAAASLLPALIASCLVSAKYYALSFPHSVSERSLPSMHSMVSHRGHNCISSALTILDSALTS